MVKMAKTQATLLNRVTRISPVMRSLTKVRAISLLIKTPLPIRATKTSRVINHPSRVTRLTIMSKVV